jgi:hypothetical protein
MESEMDVHQRPLLDGRLVNDDAVDSGYGRSVKDERISSPSGLFNPTPPQLPQPAAEAPAASTCQEQTYHENCVLLAQSIEDTKLILKVASGSIYSSD